MCTQTASHVTLLILAAVEMLTSAAVSHTEAAPPISCEMDGNSVRCRGNGSFDGQTFSTEVQSTNTTMLEITNYSIPLLGNKQTQQWSQLHTLSVTHCRVQQVSGDALVANTALSELNLSHNWLTELPKQLLINATHLRRLDLSYNRLERVEWIWPQPVVTNATTERLTVGSLTEMSSVTHGSGLQQLALNNNRLTRLSATAFVGLSQLQLLDLSSNQLQQLPAGCLTVLERLISVSLANNPLHQLQPMQLMSPRLAIINVQHTPMTHVPQPEYCHVTQLVMTHTKLRQLIANDLEQYRHVQQLILDHNMIEVLEDETFSRLKELQSLSLANNKVASVPRGLPATLRTLHLAGNCIRILRAGQFNGTKFLETISLDNNSITTVERKSFQGTSLKTLILDHNNIKTLEAGSFEGLDQLQYLSLSGNPIEIIEDNSFSSLTTLISLNLSNIKSTVLLNWTSFEALQKLQTLNLSHSSNLITFVMNSPIALASLHSLTQLDIRGNQLTTLRSDLPEFLHKLKSLYLGGDRWHCYGANIIWVAQWTNSDKHKTVNDAGAVCNEPRSVKNISIIEVETILAKQLESMEKIQVEELTHSELTNDAKSQKTEQPYDITRKIVSTIKLGEEERSKRTYVQSEEHSVGRPKIVRTLAHSYATQLGTQKNAGFVRKKNIRQDKENSEKNVTADSNITRDYTHINYEQLAANNENLLETTTPSRTAHFEVSFPSRTSRTTTVVAVTTTATAAFGFLTVAITVIGCIWHIRKRTIHPCTRSHDQTRAAYKRHSNQWKDSDSEIVFERPLTRQRSIVTESMSMSELAAAPPGSDQYFGTAAYSPLTSHTESGDTKEARDSLAEALASKNTWNQRW